MEPAVDPHTGLVRWNPQPFPGLPHSIDQVLGSDAAPDPTRLALVDGERKWTYSELESAVAVMATRFAATGLRAGDRLLWSSPNCAELVIAFLAAQRLGAVWAATSPKLPTTEEARVIQQLDPKVAVLGLEALDELPDDGPELVWPSVDPQAPAAIGFTSGTTGTPKAVVHSQHGLLCPAHVSRAVEPPPADERIGTPLALTTLNMLVLGPLSAFVRGATAVVMHRTDSSGFVADVERHGVTRVYVVPTILHDLVGDASVQPDSLSSLDRVIAGASGGRHEVIRQFADRFGIRPTLSYGLTEAPTGVVREAVDDPIGSGRGFPLPHVEVTEEDGELVIHPAASGPWARVWTPMLGYWRDPEASATALRGGALHTGDRGTIDGDGGVRVTGRLGSTINRGGELIDPTEVEAALLGCDGVSDAAVVGLPDARLGQVVAAVVVRHGDEPADLRGDLSERLPRTRIPAVLVEVDVIPRTPLGKVDSDHVLQLLAEGSTG